MKDDVLAANRKRQEEVVAEIQNEEDPSRLSTLIEQLLTLVDERQALEYQPVKNLRMPVEIKDEPVQNQNERRKTG